jgi:hypothetical protein
MAVFKKYQRMPRAAVIKNTHVYMGSPAKIFSLAADSISC